MGYFKLNGTETMQLLQETICYRFNFSGCRLHTTGGPRAYTARPWLQRRDRGRMTPQTGTPFSTRGETAACPPDLLWINTPLVWSDDHVIAAFYASAARTFSPVSVKTESFSALRTMERLERPLISVANGPQLPDLNLFCQMSGDVEWRVTISWAV